MNTLETAQTPEKKNLRITRAILIALALGLPAWLIADRVTTYGSRSIQQEQSQRQRELYLELRREIAQKYPELNIGDIDGLKQRFPDRNARMAAEDVIMQRELEFAREVHENLKSLNDVLEEVAETTEEIVEPSLWDRFKNLFR